MLIFWLAVCSEQVAGLNFNLLPYCLRLSWWKKKSDVSGTISILWRQVRQFLCSNSNYQFHGIPRASKESGFCSQKYPRWPNQDLVQGCTVKDFRKRRFPWTAELARNFPKRISLWLWLLQASAPESQGKWLTIYSKKFSKLTRNHKKLLKHTKPSAAKSKLGPKTLSHHPVIVMNQSWLAVSIGRILRKNSWFHSNKSLCDKKLAIETHLREVMLLVIAVNSH